MTKTTGDLEYPDGTVAIARLNGKYRMLRYKADVDLALHWIMDPTYDRDDYVASNWDITDRRLVDVQIIEIGELENLGAVVEASCVCTPKKRRLFVRDHVTHYSPNHWVAACGNHLWSQLHNPKVTP
jgi:hypothetical protein